MSGCLELGSCELSNMGAGSPAQTLCKDRMLFNCESSFRPRVLLQELLFLLQITQLVVESGWDSRWSDWRVLVLFEEGHCDNSSGIGISSEGQRSDLKVSTTLWE